MTSDPRRSHAGTEVDLVYRMSLDDYGGLPRLQLVAEWLSPAGRDGSGLSGRFASRASILGSSGPARRIAHLMETNPIRRSLADLAERATALRRYL